MFFQWYIGDYTIQLYEGYNKPLLGDGFKVFFHFHPYLGEDFQFDEYFSDGLKPPTSKPLQGSQDPY